MSLTKDDLLAIEELLDKKYLVSEITVEDSKIKLKLMEQQDKPAINWCGEKAVSFF